MHSISRLAAAAFGFVLVAGIPVAGAAADTGAMPAMPGPAGLTNVRTLHAHKPVTVGGGMLTGMLQQSNSCNQVGFRLSPAAIFPPIYRALQWRAKMVGCVVLNGKYVHAAIAIPKKAPFVTVQAKNGTFKVPVQ